MIRANYLQLITFLNQQKMITRRYCNHATGHEIRRKIESLLAGEGIEVKAMAEESLGEVGSSAKNWKAWF